MTEVICNECSIAIVSNSNDYHFHIDEVLSPSDSSYPIMDVMPLKVGLSGNYCSIVCLSVSLSKIVARFTKGSRL